MRRINIFYFSGHLLVVHTTLSSSNIKERLLLFKQMLENHLDSVKTLRLQSRYKSGSL